MSVCESAARYIDIRLPGAHFKGQVEGGEERGAGAGRPEYGGCCNAGLTPATAAPVGRDAACCQRIGAAWLHTSKVALKAQRSDIDHTQLWVRCNEFCTKHGTQHANGGRCPNGDEFLRARRDLCGRHSPGR